MKSLAKLLVTASLFTVTVGGFFFLEARAGQPWTHVGDYRNQALCESAFAHTLAVNGYNSDFIYELQSSTNPDAVVDPTQTANFACFHEN